MYSYGYLSAKWVKGPWWAAQFHYTLLYSHAHKSWSHRLLRNVLTPAFEGSTLPRSCLRSLDNSGGKDLRRPLAEPPPQSGVSSEIRPGCWGLYHVMSYNLREQRLHRLSRHPVPLLHSPQHEKVSPFVQTEPHSFQFIPIASLLCPIQWWRTWLHLLNNLLIGISRVLTKDLPEAVSSTSWTGPAPSAVLTGQVLQPPSW